MTRAAQDEVATYDIMREAATRAMALYAKRVTVGGPGDPAMVEIRNIRAQARAVDTRDADAQIAATAEFNARYWAGMTFREREQHALWDAEKAARSPEEAERGRLGHEAWERAAREYVDGKITAAQLAERAASGT